MFTWFYMVLHGFTWFYMVLHGLHGFTMFLCLHGCLHIFMNLIAMILPKFYNHLLKIVIFYLTAFFTNK